MMHVLASDLMQSHVQTVPIDMSLADLQKAFEDYGVSGFPVISNGKLVGVVSVRDLMRHLTSTPTEHETPQVGFYRDSLRSKGASPIPSNDMIRPAEQCVRDIMSTELVTVPANAPLREVVNLMTERHIHRLLVTEGEQLVGLISSLDVAKVCGRSDIDLVFEPPPVVDF